MIADVMRVAFVKAPNQVQVRRMPVPETGPGEVLIRLAACGVCGSDLHIAFHRAKDWRPVGHEVSGTVVRIGPGVSRVREGERVTVEYSTPCFACPDCRRGHPARCPNKVGFLGDPTGYADYIRASERVVVPVDDLDLMTAALLEPLTVALGTVERIDLEMGDTVLIIGPGPIGLMALAICRLMGARHTILAGRAHSVARLRLGEALGADRVVRVDEEDLQEVVSSEFPAGVDKVITTGHPNTVTTAVDIINVDGVISYIGVTGSEREPLTFDAHRFHSKALQLKPFGGYASPFFYTAIDLLRRGVIPTDRFITHVFPLEQLDRALETAANDKEHVVKVLVSMEAPEV